MVAVLQGNVTIHQNIEALIKKITEYKEITYDVRFWTNHGRQGI